MRSHACSFRCTVESQWIVQAKRRLLSTPYVLSGSSDFTAGVLVSMSPTEKSPEHLGKADMLKPKGCCPFAMLMYPEIHISTPESPTGWFWRWGLWGQLGHESRALVNGVGPLLRRDMRDDLSLFLSPSSHPPPCHVRVQQRENVCKPRREALPGITFACTLVLDFQPLEL